MEEDGFKLVQSKKRGKNHTKTQNSALVKECVSQDVDIKDDKQIIVNKKDFCERIIKSVFLVNCLEATSFFKHDANSDFELSQAEPSIEERVLFAGFIFQAYCTILTNVHSISELDFTDAQEDANSESYLGVITAMTGYVLFPNVSSIVNHSCDPNTSCFYTNGKTQVRIIYFNIICLNFNLRVRKELFYKTFSPHILGISC